MKIHTPRKGGYLASTATVLLATTALGLGAATLQPSFAAPISTVVPAQSNWAIEEVVSSTEQPRLILAQANTAANPSPAPSATATSPNREERRERMRERMAERHAEIEKREDKHLTAEQVRDIVAGRLAQSGNPNLKVGKVTPKEDSVVAVDIVTKTGALVTTREISTKTGGLAFREQRREARAAGDRGPDRMRGERGGERMGGGRMGGRGPAFNRGGGRAGGFNLAAEGGRPQLNLTVDQAKKLAEAQLIMLANPHLKVGAVKEKDAETITVDIVAADNSLVVQRELDRRTGRMKRGV
jgi:hypothetical protein